jgi:hypothetical protein
MVQEGLAEEGEEGFSSFISVSGFNRKIEIMPSCSIERHSLYHALSWSVKISAN